MGLLDKLQPTEVFNFFEAICQIPHGSGNEKELSEYLVAFAKKRNLEVYSDDAYNVIIKKNGSVGYENAAPVVLQAHIDMVCEKNEGKTHDFLTDPIALKIDGDFVMADNTTLGADDGIGAAYALALLDSDKYLHPPIEALFTTSEEVGMEGAMALDASKLCGKVLLNIDSEDEGKLYISCAGGLRANLHIKLKFKEKKGQAYRLFITGLKGGHSGLEITAERGNANKLIGRLLNDISKEIPFDLAFVEGGGKDNAIAREAKAVIFIEAEYEPRLKKLVEGFEEELKNEYKSTDSSVIVQCEKYDDNVAENDLGKHCYEKVLDDTIKENVINAIMLIPNGVQSMSTEISGLPESSTNLGVIAFKDEEIVLGSAVRSSIASKKFYILDQIEIIAKLVKASVTKSGVYPGWQYDSESKIRPVFIDVFEKMYGKKPELVAVHAGLECGIFAEKIKGVDLISFGPNVYNAHTPYEKISISSVERTWEYLINVLKELKPL